MGHYLRVISTSGNDLGTVDVRGTLHDPVFVRQAATWRPRLPTLRHRGGASEYIQSLRGHPLNRNLLGALIADVDPSHDSYIGLVRLCDNFREKATHSQPVDQERVVVG